MCLSLLLFAVPSTAYAKQITQRASDPACDVDVVDSANIFTSIPDLTQRVEEIQKATGAIVKIRTFQSYGFENATDIRTYKDSMVSRCTPWQGLDGQFQSNYILLVVSLQDRKSDYWVGDRWTQLDKATMENIETASMDADFHAGMISGDKSQFQAGMLAGLSQIQQKIDSNYWWAMNWSWVVCWIVAGVTFVIAIVVFFVRLSSGSGGSGGYGGYRSTNIFTNYNSGGSSGSSGTSGGSSGGGGTGGSTGF